MSLLWPCYIAQRRMQHSDTLLTEAEVAQQHHSQPENAGYLRHAMVQNSACESTALCHPAMLNKEARPRADVQQRSTCST